MILFFAMGQRQAQGSKSHKPRAVYKYTFEVHNSTSTNFVPSLKNKN